jgi:hypothetical protein
MGGNQTSERKVMTKKRPPKQRAWNKGLEVGKRDGFTPDQVKRIWGLLASQQRAPVLQGTESRLTSEHAQDLEQVLGIVCGALRRRFIIRGP